MLSDVLRHRRSNDLNFESDDRALRRLTSFITGVIVGKEMCYC